MIIERLEQLEVFEHQISQHGSARAGRLVMDAGDHRALVFLDCRAQFPIVPGLHVIVYSLGSHAFPLPRQFVMSSPNSHSISRDLRNSTNFRDMAVRNYGYTEIFRELTLAFVGSCAQPAEAILAQLRHFWREW